LVEQERELSRRQSFPPTISFAVAEWFLQATENYLSGKHSSLDRALGLQRGRGRPRPTPAGKNFERAKEVFWLKMSNRSWKQIGDQFPDADIRDLQREVERYSPDIIAEAARELSARVGRRRSGTK
jgi:hypothetical protein